MTDVKRERRSGQRVAARVPVSIKSQAGPVEATGFTRDLNQGGIFLYTDSRIIAGSELEMVLILPPELTQGAKQCGFELHSCKQCTYFDPSSRFECTQPIPERIPRKDQRNDCTFYSMRVMVEKETSTPAAQRPNDARQAFENLFKK